LHAHWTPAYLAPVEYRLLGRTGVRVSVIGLGCGGFGGVGSDAGLFGRGESEEEAFALMDRALDLGINYFDTADSYGGGTSEEMVGRWLTSRGVRDSLVLSTKVFNKMGADVNSGGLSRRHILQAVEASLRRLQTDWLDMYVTHQVDQDTAIEETLRALDDLVHAGKVRYLGASNIEAWKMTKSLWISDRAGLARLESMQTEYNLLHRTAESELLPFAMAEGLAVTTYSPLAGGWLTGKYRPQEEPPPRSRMSLRPGPYSDLENAGTFRAIDALQFEARELGVSSAAIALAWVTSHPAITAALAGPRNVEQFAAVVESLTVKLAHDDRERIGNRMDEARA